ncbi:glycosyltransferase family 1 protein [Jeotgalibacillus aurantiacus]|uniref:glycosyltransferase family 1 protein n=1 Tax=Jeotgalibacillus aurantiacus TaxID=2763266 RepID=UPI001D0B5EEA|nr:glycosyltransferase family 1 protein [Jeotgalibacillus aurantiacus]
MDRPLRILHAVVNMNRGGAETLIMNLYRNMDRKLIQFDFLTSKPGEFDEEIEKLGGKVHRIPYMTDVGHLQYQKELRAFFQKNCYSVVHAHMDKMSGFVLHAAKKYGVPIRIAHSHNTSSEGGFAARLYKELAGLFIERSVTHRFACSSEASRWLFKKTSHQALVIKNGVEAHLFKYSEWTRESIRKDLGLKPNHFVLGHIGRFQKQKNHAFLVKLLKDLIQVDPRFHLLLVGDGDLRQATEQLFTEAGVRENVTFLGVRSNVNELLQAMDVFVFPSFHEGLPVTLVEAQSTGIPCLISNRISTEVDLGMNLVSFLSIETTEEWIDQLIHIHQMERVRNSDLDQIKKQGYDIRDTAEQTATIYLQLGGTG